MHRSNPRLPALPAQFLGHLDGVLFPESSGHLIEGRLREM
jgi:hypothetical protein